MLTRIKPQITPRVILRSLERLELLLVLRELQLQLELLLRGRGRGRCRRGLVVLLRGERLDLCVLLGELLLQVLDGRLMRVPVKVRATSASA